MLEKTDIKRKEYNKMHWQSLIKAALKSTFVATCN